MSSICRTWAAGVCVAVVGASAVGQITINPGLDPWVSVHPTQCNFGAPDVPPIPAGFFYPGSDPFTGTVTFSGVPIDSAFSPADTVISRQAAGMAFFPGPPATVPIEIVALKLVSVNPIVVTGTMGPTTWDVQLQLQPTPSTGNMTIQVNPTLNGGTFDSTLQVRPRFIFTRTDASSTVMDPFGSGFLLPLNSTSAQWTVNPPPGVQYPSSGPNFYPITGQGWQSPSGGFMQQRQPTQGADCNGNGILDAIDLDNGTSYDANMNRIPDDCEATTALHQISWRNATGGFAQRYSAFGRLEITCPEPPDNQILWLNAVVNGDWVVQNCPIHNLSTAGMPSRRFIGFDLRNIPGVQVPTAQLAIELTTLPLTSLPPLTPFPVSVNEQFAARGMDYDLFPPTVVDTWFPTIPLDFINPGIIQTWTTVSRKNVGGVEEGVNGCAPGAAARSLDWMNHLYCLGLPAAIDTPQELYDKLRNAMHMMTVIGPGGGTSVAKQISGIQKCIDDNMLGNVLMVKQVMNPTGDDIINNLQAGNDVLGRVCLTDGTDTWYHRFCIVGGTKCGNEITIDIKDDDQDSAGAETGSHSGKVTGAAGAVKVSGFGNDATLVSMIVICPKRLKTIEAALKWLVGDGASGMVEGVGPLLDRIAAGHVPTAAEKAALKLWACNALDLLRYLRKQLDTCGTQAAKDAADRLITKLQALKNHIMDYCRTGSLASVNAALAQIDAQAVADFELLIDVADCNNNGIDDSVDIMNNPALDANGDCILDACQTGICCYGATCRTGMTGAQCTELGQDPGGVERAGSAFIAGGMFCNLVGPPGDMGPKDFKVPCCKSDYNKNGSKTPQDLFDYLSDWFAKRIGADLNGAPPAPGPANVTTQDLFDFLAAWFAGGCVAP